MSTYKLRYLILLILALIGLNKEMLSQESGWQQKGNLKYQIAAIDTIIQHGISVSGDTLWTFCQDSTLYYWDIETGNLINKKKFDDIYRISVDLKSYMIVKMTYISSGTLFRAYIYDIKSDTSLSDALLFNIPRPDPVFTNTILVRNYDFDFTSKKLYVSTTDDRSSPKDWGSQHSSHIFSIEKDTAIKILPNNFMGPDFIFNRDFTKIISCWHNSYSHKEYGTNEGAYLSYFNKATNKPDIIFGNSRESSGEFKPYLTVYHSPRFLNNESLMSAVVYPNLYIWDIASKKNISKFIIENQNPGIYDYCFLLSDEFVCYTNKRILLYDTLSKRIIDTTTIEGIDKNISVEYSYKSNKVLFFAVNKFGIFESQYFQNDDIPKISYDSTHVYTGLQINFYLLNKNSYDKIEWFSSNGLIGEGNKPQFIFDEPGMESITVKLTKDGNIFEKTFDNLLEVIPYLEADFEADYTEGVAPLTVRFTNKSKGDILSYKWEFWDSFSHSYTSTEENPVINFEHNGYYNVRLTINDKFNKNIKTQFFYIILDRPKINDMSLNKLFIQRPAGTYFYTGIQKGIAWSRLQTPGAFVIKDNIYLYVSSLTIYNWTWSRLMKLNNNFNLIDSITTGLFNSNSITDLDEINTSEFIFSSDWHILKMDVDLFKSKAYHTAFPKDVNSKQFNTNINDSCLTFAFGNTNSTLLLNLNQNLEQVYIDTVNTFLYGFSKYTDSMIAMVHKPVNSSNLYLKYLSTNFVEKSEHKIDDLPNVNISNIITLPNHQIAFCGFDTIDSLGIVGSLNPEGKLNWIQKFKNWYKFNRLLLNNNRVYAIGLSECFLGFLEFDIEGKQFSHNGFSTISRHTIDLDFLTKDTVLLTCVYSDNVFLYKCHFNSIKLEDIQDTIKIPGDTIKGIISQKIKVSPNPASNEVKFEFEEELIVKSIEIYNTEGVLVEILNYAGIKSKEIVLNIKKYSIGLYFVKIQTEKGNSKTKFIKS